MDRGEGRLYLGLCCSTREESEGLILGEQREWGKFCGQPTWSSGRVGLWFNRECPPEMGGWGTAMSWGREARRRWSVGSTGDGGVKAADWALSHC